MSLNLWGGHTASLVHLASAHDVFEACGVLPCCIDRCEVLRAQSAVVEYFPVLPVSKEEYVVNPAPEHQELSAFLLRTTVASLKGNVVDHCSEALGVDALVDLDELAVLHHVATVESLEPIACSSIFLLTRTVDRLHQRRGTRTASLRAQQGGVQWVGGGVAKPSSSSQRSALVSC